MKKKTKKTQSDHDEKQIKFSFKIKKNMNQNLNNLKQISLVSFLGLFFKWYINFHGLFNSKAIFEEQQ